MPPVAKVKEPVEIPAKTERIVGVLSIRYFDVDQNHLGDLVESVKSASQGETVSLTEPEARRLDGFGALLPRGAKAEDAQRFAQAKLDAYRAVRGDQEALARHNARVQADADRRAGVSSDEDADISRADAPVDEGPTELSKFIRDQELSADDTVALAEGDPERAAAVLEAEHLATGGNPRPEVVEGLKAQGA
jgi:hypothetical protein